MRLTELRNAGLIVAPPESGSTAKWELTQDVRFSLMLDELPTTANAVAPTKPVPTRRLIPNRP